MCLIPTKVISEIGLALPVFIKWDDAEYGGAGPRARAIRRCRCPAWPRGTCPGETRTTRGTGRRTTTCATGSSSRCCTRRSTTAAAVIAESGSGSCRACCRCSTRRPRCGLLAIEDVLSGPAHLHRDLGSGPSWRSCGSCASSSPTRRTRPTSRASRRPAEGAGQPEDDHHPDQQDQPADEGAPGDGAPVPQAAQGRGKRPQMALPYQDASWWVLAKLDSAAGVQRRGHQRRLVPAGPQAVPLARLAQRRSCTGGCAGNGRGWPRSTGPRRRSSPHPRSGGRPSRRPSGIRLVGREPGSFGRRRPVPWHPGNPAAVAGARRWLGGGRGQILPRSLVAAAAMAVLGVWGLARDSSMGNDEVATRWAALLSLRKLAHLLNTVDAVHGLYYLLMHGWVVGGQQPGGAAHPLGHRDGRGRRDDGDPRPAAHRVRLGRPVRRPGHGADAGHQLLRADRALLCAGLGLRPRLDAGAAARPGRRGGRRARPAARPPVGRLRRAGHAGRLPERDVPAGPGRARGHGPAGPVRAPGLRHWVRRRPWGRRSACPW